MIRPPFLKQGDTVAIVSPARSITFEEVHPAIRFFTRNGFEAVMGHHIFSRSNQFAGTDDQRRRDLQMMLDDDRVAAIVCSRGGYGTVRIVDGLDFTGFLRRPKWIVGYSDATVLHSHIHRNFGVETLHAAMPVNIREDTRPETLQTLLNALLGKRITYTWPTVQPARPGTAEGTLVGGNLSILYSLMGSKSEIDTAGKVLFLEDLDEYLYHIDRMMTGLKRAGKLAKLAGLVVGGMTKMNDNTVPFGRTAHEIIADSVKEYGYPVCFGLPAGHLDPNLALVLGRRVRLTVGEESRLAFY